MIEIIDADNIETYPLKLKNILQPYAENLYARWGENIDLDEYEAIDISALNSLNEVMSEFVFKAYHNTRVYSVESIKKEGIVLLKRESYLARMQKLLKECAVSKNEITIFSKAIKEYLNTGFENLREGCISFYMPKAQSQRYNAYAENFGGEIAKHALKDQYPSIYNYL